MLILSTLASLLIARLSAITCNAQDECTKIYTQSSANYCNGYYSCNGGTFAPPWSSSYPQYFDGYLTGNGAQVQAYQVYARGRQSLYNAKIKAYQVWGNGEYSLQNADIEPWAQYSANVYVYLYGSNAGNGADISCASGQTCYVYCDGTGCNGAELFCYSGSTCHHQCSTNDNCITIHADSESAPMTDTDIYDRYLSRRNNKPEVDLPPHSAHKPWEYVLSFTSSQFIMLFVLNGLFAVAFVGLCLYTVSSTKKVYLSTRKPKVVTFEEYDTEK